MWHKKIEVFFGVKIDPQAWEEELAAAFKDDKSRGIKSGPPDPAELVDVIRWAQGKKTTHYRVTVTDLIKWVKAYRVL